VLAQKTSATWLTRGVAGVSQRTVSDCGDERRRARPESPEGGAGLANPARREGGAASEARGWRRTLLAACAAVVAAAALGFPGSGCLNPRPEELPSSQFSLPGDEPRPAEPVRETCDDNPLLAECELPETDINADPIDAPPSQTPGDLSGQAAPDPQPAAGTEMAGGAAAGEAGGDAGTAPADAGVP
jgi:hypothetical protein